ncbi:MAG: amino acid permease [Thermoplasmata archaeon]
MAAEVAEAGQPVGPDVRIELSRDLRFFDITMIGIGAMIGAGIFVLTGSAARLAGPAAVIAFGINGLVTLLTAFTYAELGSAYSQAGGGYVWARESLPPPVGFISGWLSWAATLIACALYAAAFGSFLALALEELQVGAAFLPPEVTLGGLTFNPLTKGVTAFIVIFFVVINYVGAQSTGKTESAMTIGKMAVLGLFIVIGLNAMFRDPTIGQRFFDEFLPEGAGGIFLAMGITFIAFEGYEIIAQSGEEVKDPKRNIPRAIFLSIAVVVIFYVLTFIVALGVIECDPPSQAYLCLGGTADPERAMIEAGRSLAGPLGLAIMLAGGFLATTSALNATIYSSSRVSFAMGRDNTLPRSLGRVHPRRQSPANAVLVSGAIIVIFALVLPIEQIAASAAVMFLLLFAIANMSLLALRRKRPDLEPGFRVPLYPFIPILGIVANIGLAIYVLNFSGQSFGGLSSGQVAWYVAILWLSIGLAYRFFSGGRTEIETPRVIRREILEVIAAPVRKAVAAGRRVLLPIRDPGNLAMVRAGAQIAKERDAELLLLHVIEVPLNMPPKSVRFSYVNDRIRTLRPAEQAAREVGIPVSVLVKISHRIYETILEAVGEEGADLLVLGWRGERPARGGRVLGSNIDYLVQRVNVDVIVLKTVGMKEKLENLTLLSGRASHVNYAARIAAQLARENEARVTVLSVVPQRAQEEEAIALAHRLMEVFEEAEVPHEHKLVYSGSVLSAVERAAAETDLLVMGASPTWVLRKYAFGPLEDRIAKRVTSPTLMVRKAVEAAKPVETEA